MGHRAHVRCPNGARPRHREGNSRRPQRRCHRNGQPKAITGAGDVDPMPGLQRERPGVRAEVWQASRAGRCRRTGPATVQRRSTRPGDFGNAGERPSASRGVPGAAGTAAVFGDVPGRPEPRHARRGTCSRATSGITPLWNDRIPRVPARHDRHAWRGACSRVAPSRVSPLWAGRIPLMPTWNAAGWWAPGSNSFAT